jgi:hypothetical protein
VGGVVRGERTAETTRRGGVNRHQRVALDRHCRLSIETMHPDFGRVLPNGRTVVLTVNSGYE